MPKPKSKGKTVKVKAWGIYSIKKRDLADIVCTSRKKMFVVLEDTLHKEWWKSNLPMSAYPSNRSKVLENYKVVPCTIVYQLPKKTK